jgi:tetratricopeptide (TPR) repeat protein
MDERLYRFLKYTAITMALLWAGWTAYDTFFARTEPGEYAYHAATNHFADRSYDRALVEYDKALQENPGYTPALRGRAETLIMLDREPEAIEIYDQLIALQPDNAGHYANRGIAHDRLGHFEQALADYVTALALDPEVGEGPGWLTRFLRNQPEKLPGIADRARYIQEQLTLPAAERVLQVPEVDASARPFKK